MDRFTAKQLVEHLAVACPDLDDEVLDIIRTAKVTGKRALKYDVDAWSKIGLAFGDILEIIECIQNFSSSVGNKDKENSPPVSGHTDIKSGPSKPDVSLSSHRSLRNKSGPSKQDVTLSSRQSLNNQSGPSKPDVTLSSHQSLSNKPGFNSQCNPKNVSKGPLEENSSDSEGEVIDTQKFECLRQFFSAEEFNGLSVSVKQSYLDAKENYEFGLDHNVSIDPPSFMISKKSVESETVIEGAENDNQKQNDVPTMSSQAPSKTVGEEAENDKQKQSDVPTMSSQAPSKKPRRKRQRLIDTLSDEEVFNKLPKFDIEAILSAQGEKEKDILKVLNSEGIVYEAQRKLMMRTLTKYLYFDEKGILKKFVSTDEKSGMAASVVKAYPKFADNSDPNRRPWWRIFDPAGPSGYIANCIVGIQRAMNPSDRLRGGGQGKLVDVDENSDTASTSTSTGNYHDPDAEWMSLTMPYLISKSQLIQGMQKSFPIRRRWIVEQCPSITEVLERYVHLVSFDTEMVEMEFNMIHADKSALFLQKFPTLVSAVLRLNGRDKVKVKMIEKGENKDTIEACLFLADKLPRPNLKRFANSSTDSVMPKQKTLVACVPRGVNVQDFIQEKRENVGVPVQPYLLAFVPEGQVTSLSIVVDSKTINLQTTSILKGLDMLFKVYYVFNVHYPLGWKMFWEMVQNGIYEIEPRKLTNSAREILLRYKAN